MADFIDDAELADAKTEAQYMDALRSLRVWSGLSVSEVHARWTASLSRTAPSRSTVYGLFKKDKLPSKSNQLGELLTVLVQAGGGRASSRDRYFERGVRLLTQRERRLRSSSPSHPQR